MNRSAWPSTSRAPLSAISGPIISRGFAAVGRFQRAQNDCGRPLTGACRPRQGGEENAASAGYFRLAKVRSAASLAMNAAPHHLELKPSGLVGLAVAGLNAAVWSPVRTLQLPFDRSVS